jgi:phosphoenolpyruvate carboxykinase (ATP)
MALSVQELSGHLAEMLEKHPNVTPDPSRRDMIGIAIEKREAIPSANGALATWTPTDSTGRSPKDTYIVRRPESEKTIDWDSPNCIPMDPETFDMLWDEAIEVCKGKERLFYTDRVIGADATYALPVRTVSYQSLTMLFTDNMFRAVPDDLSKSVFSDRPFLLLVVPYDKINADNYKGRLRELPNGKTSSMAIVADFDRRMGLVFGSAYAGSVKKLMFTVMNYMLPAEGILPLHCSANEGKDGDCALLLGLSGTGKTTLSADPSRALLGDDEHGWNDTGVANFENGCYAKLINLRQDKEPEIWEATFHKADPLDHGAMIENCMMYPPGNFDVDDDRLTPNSRVSYPLNMLSNIKTPPVSGHPKTILFLAADANGVLPPIARLDKAQAMLWFIMGYTSKLAGTETGVTEPKSAFSRFFGAPFMPRNPDDYASLLGKKMDEHNSRVYLVNTGWAGGPYGVGERMDIMLTRALVDAALSGKLENVEFEEDPLFHVAIPKECPGVDSKLLFPKNTWADKAAYDDRAQKLASEFATTFDKTYGNKGLDPKIVAACPGK